MTISPLTRVKQEGQVKKMLTPRLRRHHFIGMASPGKSFQTWGSDCKWYLLLDLVCSTWKTSQFIRLHWEMGYHSSLFQNGPFYFSSPPAFFNLYDTGCCRKSSFSNAQLQYCFLAKGGQLRKQLLTEGLAARSRKIITEAKTSSYSQTPTLGVW